jgi:hypothetical protein
LVQVKDSTDKIVAMLHENNLLGLKNWTYKNESYDMKFSQVSFAVLFPLSALSGNRTIF